MTKTMSDETFAELMQSVKEGAKNFARQITAGQ
jgi:hypothetical protein